MDTLSLAKSYDFFKPEICRERLHIIGCGSVGSTVAELLVRFGLTKLTLYDFDKVEPHNLANQMFRREHIGESKVEALIGMLGEINPEITSNIKAQPYGYTGQNLSGYVFLCVDSIELRQKVAKTNQSNPHIKAMFDFRTRLTDAQHYAADWSDLKMVEDFIKSMDFTHDEAMAETPVSACNVALSVAPTVRMICSLGVANFVNFAKGEKLKKLILCDAFGFQMSATVDNDPKVGFNEWKKLDESRVFFTSFNKTINSLYVGIPKVNGGVFDDYYDEDGSDIIDKSVNLSNAKLPPATDAADDMKDKAD